MEGDYTISVNIPVIQALTIRLFLYNSAAVNVGSIVLHEGKNEMKIRGLAKDNYNIFILLSQHSINDRFIVENIKLEIGNIATDWSPAPEDVDSNIALVQTTAAADATTKAEAAKNTATAVANTAQTAANNAQAAASLANNLLSDIANDNKLTPTEKQDTKLTWDEIVTEKPKIEAEADMYGLPKIAYQAAYNSLNTYLTPLLSNLNITSNIVGTAFRQAFVNYYSAKQDLLKLDSIDKCYINKSKKPCK